MKQPNSNPTAAASDSRKHITTSPDGKWETFHKHAGLMRYVPSGIYFARFKIAGAIKRESLKTTDKTSAVTLLAGAREKMVKPKAEIGTFQQGRELFEHQTRTKHDLEEPSRLYRLDCVKGILKTWPGIDPRRVDTITLEECQTWAKKCSDEYCPQRFNNCLFYVRQIMGLAGLKRDDNPAYKIPRRGVPRKKLELPTADQFNQILKVIETKAQGIDEETRKDSANYVRFLAFSGTRWREAAQSTWKDVDWKNNELTIHCAKRRATSSESRTRIIPIVPAMRDLLQQFMVANPNPGPDDPICKGKICRQPLMRACKVVGVGHLTHHSMRHLFATFCIEAGIDIPTVSRWLGHSDGGALAMKVYGHLRREHSQRMAERITFGLPPVPVVPALPAPKELQPA